MINPQELLYVVDENNKPAHTQTRKAVHAKNIWHRTSGIWVLNRKKQILCQKRSLKKDMKPGYWEAFFGGHLKPGESYLENAATELSEELGITTEKTKLIFHKLAKSDKVTHKEFQAIYLYSIDREDIQFPFEKEEIDIIEWFDLDKLYNILVKENDVNWVHKQWDKEILDYIKKTEI
jgi:isopentenyldiphosphate isomerase